MTDAERRAAPSSTAPIGRWRGRAGRRRTRTVAVGQGGDRRQEPHHRAGQPAVDAGRTAQAARASRAQSSPVRRRSSAPSARSAGRHQDRVAATQRVDAATVGPSASAASTSARLVSDFDAGQRHRGSHRPVGARCRPRLAHDRERSARGLVAERTTVSRAGAPGPCGRRAGPRGGRPRARASGAGRRVVCGVLRAPGQAGPALGVDGGEDQAAEHGDVLEEVDALLGSLGGVLLLPEPVRRPASSAPGCRRAASDDSRGKRPSASISPAPTWTAPLIRTREAGSSGR